MGMIKYLVDGYPASICWHYGKHSYWYAHYYKNGKRHQQYLDRVDPRTKYERLPLEPGEMYLMSTSGTVCELLHDIATVTGEHLDALQERLLREEMERIERKRAAG